MSKTISLTPLNLTLLSGLLLCAAQAAPIKDSTLSGKITDWPAGQTGEVQLRVLDYVADKTDTALATAPINEQGEFSLKLPDAAALAKVLPPKDGYYSYGGACQGSLTLDPAAQINFFDLIATQGGKVLSNVKYRTSRTPWPWLADHFQAQQLVFASASTSADGAASCDLSSSPFIMQNGQKTRIETTAALAAGWNTVTATQKGSKVMVGDDPMPDTAFWHIHTGYGGIGLRPTLTDDKKNIKVLEVFAGGPAETAGVKVGDLLIALDDYQIDVNDPSGAAAHSRGEEGTTVVLTVKRGTETLKIPIKRQFVLSN